MNRVEEQPRYFPVQFTTPAITAGSITADEYGLRLSPNEVDGPLALNSPDGSVGRRTLPRGFALDTQLRGYFVQRSTGDIWFYDSNVTRPANHPFRRIGTFPVESTSHNKLAERWSLAANSESLFIVQPTCPGLISVALDYWAIQDIHCFSADEFTIDVATLHDHVYVLTNRALYVRQAPWRSWEILCDLAELPKPHQAKDRLLIGAEGTLFIYSAAKNEIYSVAEKKWLESTARSQFPAPAIVTHPVTPKDEEFQYIIPASLTNPCERRLPNDPMKPLAEQANAIPPELAIPQITIEMLTSDCYTHGFLIGENGTRVRKDDYRPSNVRMFQTGQASQPVDRAWISVIDSHRYRCRWDRVELTLKIPPSGKVVVSTWSLDPHDDFPEPENSTADQTDLMGRIIEKAHEAADSSWSEAATFQESTQLKATEEGKPVDFLVRSQPGRFLFLRVQLTGDGFSTPVVKSIIAKGPRQSHVDFLPAVMREDDLSRDFLERFFSVFQTEWDQLDDKIASMDRMFNAAAIPDPQLNRLADWLGISLPAGWNKQQCRQLLQFAPKLLLAPGDERRKLVGGTRRGTVEHLRSAVLAILAGLTGLTEQQMRGFPWIIEGFRERNQLRLGGIDSQTGEPADDRLSPPVARTLWGPDSTGRLQLGDNSKLGERKLLPTNRQELDLYRTYAHRIRVVVPACWFKSCDDKQVLETMLEAEKPAHVASEISYIRPGMRIGLQSTLGIDTILGDWPPVVLSANPPPTLGLGQGLMLPPLEDESPPPLSVNGPLGIHKL